MQSNRPQSRLNFIDPAYAEIPWYFHWLLNTLGAIGLAGPYLTVLVPCFAAVWGAEQLQLLFGSAAYGAVSALMSMIRTGATILGIEMLFTMYCTRHEWEEVVRRIIHDACEEFLQPWLR
ncbi:MULTISPECIES: hypothetical protein [Paraburkholderia]|uniref:hypothetical protein n=1 Tax=Paraburkholderia TaxID=1822464 RepID=UPI002258243A|nr:MULTISPECIES: hypothetical protein [Paraburkholderia]MCX4177443.1 hypothetical protein [Paraburkholderia madseniana]MDQ6465432.1 hypothetical protein [Paraburkholderia madseniana]